MTAISNDESPRDLLHFILCAVELMGERDHQNKPTESACQWPWLFELGQKTDRGMKANRAAAAIHNSPLFALEAIEPTVHRFTVWEPALNDAGDKIGNPIHSTFTCAEDGMIVFDPATTDERFKRNGLGINPITTTRAFRMWLPLLDPEGEITTIGDVERGAFVSDAIRDAIWDKLPAWDGRTWGQVREALQAAGRTIREIEAMALRDAAGAITPRGDGISEKPRKTDPPKSKEPVSHNTDFTQVTWYGQTFAFAKGLPSEVVGVLWKEWENTGKGLHSKTITECIDSGRDKPLRLDHVFRDHPAFGNQMIQAGLKRGSFQLGKPQKISKNPKITKKSR